MRLIHPIYLDVPMLVSFAAALQGGLSFGTEVTQAEGAAHSATGKLSGKLGLSNLFSSLFDASVVAESADQRSDETREFRRESKAHTEASIAILLYDELQKRDGYLVRPASVDDLEALEPGSLVEVGGTIEKNAVDSVIDYADAVSILASLDTTKTNTQKKATALPVNRIREALEKDRKRTPISNVHLRCSEPEGLNVILTLRTENLRDLTLSELHKNTVRLVGKVTRRIGSGESMSSFENYGLSLMAPDQLKEAFDGIGSTEGIVADFAPVQVEGPAVQILPLMVFV